MHTVGEGREVIVEPIEDPVPKKTQEPQPVEPERERERETVGTSR